jgi:hypothetical protein
MLEAIDDYCHEANLMASQLRFGAFLTEHFADEIVALRRARERAAELALGMQDMPVTEIEPVTIPSDPPHTRPSAPPRASALDSRAEPKPSSGAIPLLWVALGAAVAGAIAWAVTTL